ncbi:MAG: DUF4347 domain-containing protein, partial [Spirulina sp. SIO3F2]|nr:DUF4347 domain-containing protein [Spirulina sp. SIO3F2]
MFKTLLGMGGSLILPCVLTVPLTASLTAPTVAQSMTAAPDGTGTIIHHNGDTYHIQGGTQAGANLFHSFQALGLSSGEIANFLSNPSVTNILGRVTGGDPSIIEGLIQVTGANSNLYLMNPAGFVFGAGASLNVGGDFFATTADRIAVGDGWFMSTGVNDYAALVGTPNQFAFLSEQPGAILNFGELQSSQNVSLIGGTVLNEGVINSATVTMAAVPGERLVRVSQPGMLLSLEISTAQMAAGITPVDLPTLLTGAGAITEGLPLKNGDVVIAGKITGQQVDLYAAGQVTPTDAGLVEGDTRVTRFSETGENPGQAVFIDRRADHPEQLPYGAAAGTVSQIIEQDEDGVALVSEQLAEISDAVGKLESVAIVTEGNEGNFWLGNQWLHSENIGDYAAQLQSWGEALTENADLLLYSCFTALGETGQALIDSMATLTGADVAASVDATGSANYGGNWLLESSTGVIESGNPFTTATLNSWDGKLATWTVINIADSGVGSLRYAIETLAGDGDLINFDTTGLFSTAQTINIGTEIDWTANNLTLDGPGQNNLTLDGGGNQRIFDISATNATIQNLTLTRGRATGTANHGGAIRHNGTGTLTVNNSTLSSNTATFGGGIYTNSGSIILSNATLSGNLANSVGGGIATISGTVTLTNNSSVSNNTANQHGGGIRTTDGDINIIDSTVSNNSAFIFTGGIRSDSGNITLTNSTVSGNSSPKSGAGIKTGSSANVTLINSTVSGNSTGQAGAGILGGGTIVLDNSSVSNNLAAGYAGGMRTEGNVEIKNNSTVSGNSGAGAGGGIWANAGDVTITDSTVSNNSAGSHAGGVRVQLGNLTVTNSTVSGNSAGDNGGGLRTHTGNITVTNSTVENNTSGEQGGGIFTNSGTITLTNTTVGNNSATNHGGGIRSQSGNVAITNSTISTNTSGNHGGGIRTHNGNITVMNSTISNNSSVNEGGGLKSASGTVTLTNANVLNNSGGADGGGIHTVGGAINLTNNSTVSGNSSGQTGGGIRTGSGTVTVTNSTVSSNTAANNGGGIGTNGGAVILNSNSTVTSNRAGADGGGVRTESGTITVTNSTVSNNVASNDGGGIQSGSGTINLTNNAAITNNFSADDGGGIQTDSGTISVANSTISGNGASDRGGGLYAGVNGSTGGTINLTDSTLSGNFGAFGGGMAASGAEITATRSNLSGNFAPAYQTLYTDKTNVNIIDHPGNLNLAVSAYEGNLFASASGSVTVTGRLNPLGGDLTIQSGSSIDLTPVQLSPTRGGDVKLTAGGDITTKNIFTAATNTGNGGDITLTSTGGAVNTQGNSTAGSLDARAANGNGGRVTINAAKNISTGAINTEAFNGIGGAVTVESPDSFVTIDGTVSSSFVSFPASISTAGTNGGGSILIRHGGNGLVPFKVGDASINGTSAAITAGGSYTIGVGNTYLYSHTQPGIQILTDGAPAATSLPTILAGVEPINQTLTTANLLQMIAEQAGGEVFVDEGMGMTPEQDLAGFEIPGEGGWPLWGGSFEDEVFTSYVLSVDDFFTNQFETPSQDIAEPDKSSEKEDEEGSIANIREVFKEITEKTGTVPAIIYAFSQLEGLELIVITPDEHLHRTIVHEADRQSLRRTIRTFRRRISSIRSDYLDSAQQLHNWFIQPIEGIIKDLNVDTLIFAMGEGLRGLPLAALHDGEQFLVENYSLGQIPSLSLINSRYESLDNAQVVAMGASQFETLQPLPAVPSELALVTSVQSGEHYLNEQFTWDNLERHSRERSFDVVHLATHAAFRAGNASNSYIQLWGEET